MDAGKLRTRVGILTAPTARNAFNEVDESTPANWTTTATVWAGVNPLSGVLLDIAQARGLAAVASLAVTMRFNPLVTVNNRLAVPTVGGGTKYLTVQGITDAANKHAMMTLFCSEARSNN